jgi:hypothetical protein
MQEFWGQHIDRDVRELSQEHDEASGHFEVFAKLGLVAGRRAMNGTFRSSRHEALRRLLKLQRQAGGITQHQLAGRMGQ